MIMIPRSSLNNVLLSVAGHSWILWNDEARHKHDRLSLGMLIPIHRESLHSRTLSGELGPCQRHTKEEKKNRHWLLGLQDVVYLV